MATIDGLNSVYGKREGSGQAYILPQNQSISIFANGLANQQERQRLLDAAALKRQQELQDDNLKYLEGLKTPEMWESNNNALLQNEFNKYTKDSLMATKNGVNLRGDQDNLKNRKRLVMAASAYGDLKNKLKDWNDKIGTDPDGYKNAMEVRNAILNANPFDYLDKKIEIPELKKQYVLADVIKETGAKPTYEQNEDGTWDITKPNVANHVQKGIEAIDSIAGRNLIEEAGGVYNEKYKNGFVEQVKRKDGTIGRIWTEDPNKAKKLALDQLLTDPNFVNDLQKLGYETGSPEQNIKSATDFVLKQNKAVGGLVNSVKNTLNGDVDIKKKRSYEAERMAMSRADQQMQQTTFNERGNPKDEGVLYRQQLIEDMWNEVPGSGEKVRAIVGAKSGYDKSGLQISIDGTNIHFKVPERTITTTDATGYETTKILPERTVIVDRTKPEDKSKMNELLNDLTGEKVNESKFRTGNASGKIKAGQSGPKDNSSKITSASKIKSLIGKPGYEGYTEKELLDYYKSQGYTIK